MSERDEKWEQWDREIRCVWKGSKPAPKPEPKTEEEEF